MALIKNNENTVPIQDTVVLDFSDLNGHAKRVVEESKTESVRVINEAKERGFREGYERGVAEGRSQGESKGREQAQEARSQEIDHLITEWKSALATWQSDRKSQYGRIADEVIQLVYLLVHKVICRMVQIDTSIVRDQLIEALALLRQTAVIEIAINPDDRRIAQEALPELLSSIGVSRHVKLSDNPNLKRGGCVIKTSAGKVDASIESQLDCIADAIMPTSDTSDL